jgi:hypothetical protein
MFITYLINFPNPLSPIFLSFENFFVAVSIVPKSNFKDSAFVISFAISFASMIQKKKRKKKERKNVRDYTAKC